MAKKKIFLSADIQEMYTETTIGVNHIRIFDDLSDDEIEQVIEKLKHLTIEIDTDDE